MSAQHPDRLPQPKTAPERERCGCRMVMDATHLRSRRWHCGSCGATATTHRRKPEGAQ